MSPQNGEESKPKRKMPFVMRIFEVARITLWGGNETI